MNIRNICGLTIAALILSSLGCKKESASTPGTPDAPGATAAPITAATIPGKWVFAKADVPAGLPANFADNFKDDTFTLKPDGTFRRTNKMMGGYGGSWNLDGNKLTLTNGPDEHELLRGKSVNFTVEGAQLVNRQDGGMNFYFDRARADSAEPKYKLTAYQLYSEYKNNKAAAQAKYEGQIVEVSGTVDMIPQTYGGESSIRISSPRPADATGPEVKFDLMDGLGVSTIDKEPFARLAPGQTATFRGKCMFSTGLWIMEAEIVSAGPSPAVTTTAVDLATEFAKDADATKKKYETGALSGKVMIVTGDLLATEKDKDSTDLTGVVIGTGDKKVYCHIDRTSDTNKRLAALKPGQPLKLVGEFSGASSTDPKAPYIRMCRFATVK
jgi:hypothetical protein